MSVKQSAQIGKGKPGPGRPKGVPNKLTASIKGAFLEAFEHMGGAEALFAWGQDNPTEFYKLAARLIPTEVTGKDGEALISGVVILPPTKP